MPGANCSIQSCFSSRYGKDLAIFGLPKGTDDYSMKWRTDLVHIITKDRVIDKQLRKQMENKTLHVCELHFEEHKIRRRKYIKNYHNTDHYIC